MSLVLIMDSAVHASNSAKKFGGKAKDYLDIHEFLDSSKAFIGDNRHRALTHNTWFIREVIPRIFGRTRLNSSKKQYSTVAVAERHVLEDFDMLFVPTPQDFLHEIPMQDWMDNARRKALPPSRQVVGPAKRPSSIQRKTQFPDDWERPNRCGGGLGLID